MLNANEIGMRGEYIARRYLEQHGFHVLESNWRYKRAEIDLIVKEGDTLVFVEVKTSASTSAAAPDGMVDSDKEAMITGAAHVYMERIGHDWEIRFDVVAVWLRDPNEPAIRHIRDAFFLGLSH
jgi:putative endonuclease